jgi:branched-chain amino acid transport system permease protein
MIETLLFQGLTGLSQGMFLWLISSGLTLVFGILGVLNFAQGSFYMLGAFTGYSILKLTGSFWLAALFGPVGVGVVAFFLEKFLLKPAYKLDESYQLLLTFGFALVLENIAKLIWGSGYIASPSVSGLNGFIMLFSRPFPTYYLFIIVMGFATVAILWYVLKFTWPGRVLIAASTNQEMAASLGVNVSLLYSVVFALGAILSALGGVLSTPITVTSSGVGDTIIIKAFLVIVIGGLGSLRGAFVASLIVGLIESYGVIFLPSFEMAMIYIIVIFILLFKPSGLFPENV